MILVDTSVWVDHLRTGDLGLAEVLTKNLVLVHPMVLGEIALGTLRNRRDVLDLLDALPQAPVASHDEAMAFVEARALHGRGIGYVDAHLLASAALTAEAPLWTRDKRLRAVADDLNVAAAIR